MNVKEKAESAARRFDKCAEMLVLKGNAYGGNSGFGNLENSVIVGVSVERGILVRLMDKISRIQNLINFDENINSDESIDDSINDAINYLALLGAYREYKKGKK
jgi:hypothetical protein